MGGIDIVTATWRIGRADLWRNNLGNLTIEFAFIAPFLIFLAMGTFEMSRVAIEQLRLASAAQAGVVYGSYDLSAARDAEGIAAAARSEAGPAPLTVSSRSFCACPEAAETACSSACPDAGVARRYVEVQVERDLDLFFSYPIEAGPFRLSTIKAVRLN